MARMYAFYIAWGNIPSFIAFLHQVAFCTHWKHLNQYVHITNMYNIQNLFTLEAEEPRYLGEDNTSSLHWFHVTKRKHIYIAFVSGLDFFLMVLYLSLRIAKECANIHCHIWHANWHIKPHNFAFFPAWKICQKWIPLFFSSTSHQSEGWIWWWWW